MTSVEICTNFFLLFSYIGPTLDSENYLQACSDGIIFAMSSGRSLLSLGLQKEVLGALTRNGYENLRDLTTTTAEGLAKGETYSPNQLSRFSPSPPP